MIEPQENFDFPINETPYHTHNGIDSPRLDHPIISFGGAAPTSTPFKIGDIYVDKTAAKVYIATGNSSAADWTLIN